MNEGKIKKDKLVKYRRRYGDKKTRWFLDSVQNPVIDRFFDPIIKLLTNDRRLNLLYEFSHSRLRKLPMKILDILAAKIEKKLGITHELRKSFFGLKGSIGKRSTIAHFMNPILRTNIRAWKRQQQERISNPRMIHKVQKIPKVWENWKKLRDKVCPNFNINPKKGEIIKILPHDTMRPKDRIRAHVEFKDVDRVGLGFGLSHAISFMGAQPKYNIGGLWQYTYGPGTKMAKAVINTWIRIGGNDYLPSAPMVPLANPIPEAHSPFYYKWNPPTDLIYEQFLETELIKNYDKLYDWGLTSFAQEVSKNVIYRALLGAREIVKGFMAINKYFPKHFRRNFIEYSLSICALWDVVPMARGMIPFMKDLRKKKEEIIQIFEFLEPGLTELGILIGKITGAKYVLLGNSRGSSSWISPKMFEEVFWPSQKATWEKLVKAGFLIAAHLDNDWTENMEYMLELPKRSGFFHLDQSDLPKVREIIGDHFCLMGNLQPSITTGSGPDIVYKVTKKLIDACGEEGGYIVATGCEAPATIPVENYYAVKRAIIDHGYFKK